MKLSAYVSIWFSCTSICKKDRRSCKQLLKTHHVGVFMLTSHYYQHWYPAFNSSSPMTWASEAGTGCLSHTAVPPSAPYFSTEKVRGGTVPSCVVDHSGSTKGKSTIEAWKSMRIQYMVHGEMRHNVSRCIIIFMMYPHVSQWTIDLNKPWRMVSIICPIIIFETCMGYMGVSKK